MAHFLVLTCEGLEVWYMTLHERVEYEMHRVTIFFKKIRRVWIKLTLTARRPDLRMDHSTRRDVVIIETSRASIPKNRRTTHAKMLPAKLPREWRVARWNGTEGGPSTGYRISSILFLSLSRPLFSLWKLLFDPRRNEKSTLVKIPKFVSNFRQSFFSIFLFSFWFFFS